jgi:4-hydroxy-tetrahydrodipicolinate synthase
MRDKFPEGVWPTMITPFNENNKIDFPTLQIMIDWYINQGVSGLFAVCQSSEMFKMSLEERIALAASTIDMVKKRIPVIASGHISDSLDDQIHEANRIIDTGIDAFVFVSNRFAGKDDSDEVFFGNLKTVLSHIPLDIPLGLYECPYPYKRLLGPELLHQIASTGRFYFLKDTSCSVSSIIDKLQSIKGTQLKLYNANTATLLSTLQIGAVGYSGIMANVHPDLYVWLCNNWSSKPELAEKIHWFLTTASVFENQLYPVNAKYYQQLEGIPIKLDCRLTDHEKFGESKRIEVEQMRALSKFFSQEIAQLL